MGRAWESLPAKKNSNGLNKQQERAIDFFFGAANFQKVKALRLAGYGSPQDYTRFWNHPAVEAEVERRYADIRKRYEVNYERVVEELARVAYSNPTDFLMVDPKTGEFTGELDLTRCTAAEMAALGEIQVDEFTDEDGNVTRRVKVKPWNKLTALESLMKHAGLSKDRSNDALEGLGKRIQDGFRRIQKPEDE